MPPDDRIFGAERHVLYLEAAKQALDDIDGSREKAIRSSVEKFQSSPASAFDDHPGEFFGKIRDLDTNTRAFATWCQNHSADAELCVVQVIYKKTNEDEIWAKQSVFNREGRKFTEGIQEMNPGGYEDYIDGARNNPDLLLVE